ncbi:amino acid adenylation domain-containing protein [Paenibacillus donghaensis]|uniref:non-ribosomal peptide synthetase n=1 Tax=Paenibacillus donghaensis TaxID=414771 RepID=UPI001883B931|nr:amino acid adenylation domain-containing protein [Paenibacillus donghaensis]MBE9913476.1 amino acid adenylation domain-containing protein [Paenibacillus donghaensis]
MRCEVENEALLSKLHQFNRTESEYSSDITVVKWLEEAAASSGEQPAIYDGDQVYTYNRLNRDANRLAHALLDRNLGPGAIVAMILKRSYSMMVCIHGILKAGAAYLPLDPNCPSARLKKMLTDSSAALALVEAEPKFLGSEPLNMELISVEALELDRFPDHDPAMQAQPCDLAYLIYTSGSTGDPKGVLVEHGGLVNRIEWMQKAYPLTSSDVLFQKTVYTFDVSVWELIWWTVSGASVVLLPSGKENDPRRFVKLIEKRGISVIHFVPSVLRLFLDYIETDFDIRRLSSLRYVFCSGEALPAELAGRFYSIFPREQAIRLINLYGPTEATIDVSHYMCERDHGAQHVPIGKPIDNIRFYILREDLTLARIGETGRLYLSGIGLARGYLNSPELTRARFVSNPYEPGGRMYRTGDLAYWNEHGEVIYMGREDNQVKLRGLRIELEEIEGCLLRCDRIKNAVVGVHVNESGDQILTAYIAGGSGSDLEIQRALQSDLICELPEYAIPTRIIRVDEIPLKPNGKADRSLLFSIHQETAAIAKGAEQ